MASKDAKLVNRAGAELLYGDLRERIAAGDSALAESVAEKAPAPYPVTITEGSGAYYANHTLAEIAAAIQAGKEVYTTFERYGDTFKYPLCWYRSNSATFALVNDELVVEAFAVTGNGAVNRFENVLLTEYTNGILFATEYDELEYPVAKGTYCHRQMRFYRAKQTISASETWTSGHWEEVKLADEIAGVRTDLLTEINQLDVGLSVVNGAVCITYEEASA